MKSRSASFAESVVLLLALFASGCGDGKGDGAVAVAVPPEVALILDEAADPEARLDAMDALRAPAGEAVLEALLRVMKDKSQQAFILVRDDSPLGYHAEESPFGGPDLRAEIRWTAIRTLERLDLRAAWPDLHSALFDRHPVVRNHAARALFALGSKAGLPILQASLEEKAFGNETANRMLEEITGFDAGFDTDGGWSAKLEAIARWRQRLQDAPPQPKHAPPAFGEDQALDRRTRFLVDMLGQHQFLFMEQARRNLSAMGDNAVQTIDAALGDSRRPANQQLRAYAVQVLENLATASSREVLRRLLADPDAPVRSRAALALGRLRDVDSETALLGLLADDDPSVVLAAARALGGAGKEEASRKALAGKLPGQGRLRLVAALALVRRGDHGEAADFVLDRMEHGDVDQRIEIAETLAEWRQGLLGFDPDQPGTEQGEALRAWARILRAP